MINSKAIDAGLLSRLKSDPICLISAYVILCYVLIGVGVSLGWIAQDWDQITEAQGYSGFSFQHWLGTNFNGQDVLQRVLASTKTSVEVGIVTATIAVGFGAILGMIGGLNQGKWIDLLIHWLCGCVDLIPLYLFAASISIAFNGPYAIHMALITTLWTSPCRLIRAKVLQLRNMEFIIAARAMGLSSAKIVQNHMIPHMLPILMIEASLAGTSAIKMEAVLSFLGVGVKDGISWGIMLSEASSELMGGFYQNFVAASVFMFGLVYALNLFVDALQEAVNPKLMR